MGYSRDGNSIILSGSSSQQFIALAKSPNTTALEKRKAYLKKIEKDIKVKNHKDTIVVTVVGSSNTDR